MSCSKCGDDGHDNPNPLNSCDKLGCDNPCGSTGPNNSASCETLPSQIDNFTLQFFGEVVKTEVDGRVVWSLPCELDQGLPANPRGPTEPLGCYILRLFQDGIIGEQGDKGETGDAGTDGTSAYTIVQAPFATPSLEHPYVQIVTRLNANIVTGENIFIEGSGWYNVVGTDGTGVLFTNLISRLSDAVAIVPAGAVVVPAGQTGTGTKGPAGDKGLKGDPGIQGPKGLPGNDAVSVTQNNGFFFTTSGFDYNIDTATFGEAWQPVFFSTATPPPGAPSALDPIFTLPNAGTYLIVGKSAVNAQADIQLKLFSNTNNSDVPGTVQLISPSAANEFRHCTFAAIYIAGGADTIQLYAKGLLGFMDGGLAGANATVFAIAVQPVDQKIVVGGAFTTMNGSAPRYLTRLKTDGSLDTTFNTGNIGPNNNVRTIGLLSDGRIVIGGDFTTYTDSTGTYTVNRFAVLNADGSLVVELQTFNPNVNGNVFALDVQSDDKVVIGGAFTSVHGTTRNRVARIRTDAGFVGALDTTWGDTFSGANDTVFAVKILASGDSVVGGQFTHARAQVTGAAVPKTSRIAKFIGTTGFPDNTWPNTTTANQFNSPVYAVEEDSTNRVLAGGSFTTYDGSGSPRFILLKADGSIDTLSAGFNNDVRSLAFDSSNNILVGGLFTKFSASNQTHVARLQPTGALDTSLGDVNVGVAGDTVYSFIAEADGKLLLGGTFISVQTVPRGRIARVLSDGSLNTVPAGAQTVPYLYTDLTWTQIA